LTIPECACRQCIERQLEQFAPQALRISSIVNPSPLLHERPHAQLPTVAERLSRPAL
jgi:hypothetical protein